MKLKELHEAKVKSNVGFDTSSYFNVHGDYDCSDLELTSLKGSPKKTRGDFKCTRNDLTSLEGAPSIVGADFNCSDNKLITLKGAPKEVNGSFYCDFNELTSLEGSPIKIPEHFICNSNELESLKGAPEEVGNSFFCTDNNKLTSLEGAPKIVGGDFICSGCNLTSLEGIHLKIKHIGARANFQENPIESHVLGLLLIDGLLMVNLDSRTLEKIINKYLRGSRDVIDCQNELMDAGFDEYAQL